MNYADSVHNNDTQRKNVASYFRFIEINPAKQTKSF